MHNITFRGLYNRNTWAYGAFNPQDATITSQTEVLVVDPATVTPATGLSDCHQNPIFEGDILRLRSTYSNSPTVTITWNAPNAAFVGTLGDFIIEMANLQNFEIVGNIFQKP